MRASRWLVVAGLPLLVISACGGGSSSKGSNVLPANVGATVVIKDIGFHPSRVTVKSGQAVVWTFDDGNTPHNVIGDGFRSSERTSGVFVHTFSTAGVYDYQCSLHDGMHGQVVVTQ